MIRKLLLVCAMVIMSTGHLIIASDFKNMSEEALLERVNKNFNEMGSWQYSFFKDLKENEMIKKNFDDHISALSTWYNKRTNHWAKDVSSKMDDLLSKFLRFNEHCYYTIKDARQSYLPLPKGKVEGALPLPGSTAGADFYKFWGKSIKPQAIKKSVDLLKKEYQDLSSMVQKRLNAISFDAILNEFTTYCDKTFKALENNYAGLEDECNALVKVLNNQGVQTGPSDVSSSPTMDENSFSGQWAVRLRSVEVQVTQDNKELLPQFKKIKDAAMALVQYVGNKGKQGYREDQKRNELKAMLPELQKMQKTTFQKKYFFAKKKIV